MGVLLNLALLIGAAGIFLSANGPSRVSSFIDGQLNKSNDVDAPIDQGNTAPEEPDLSPGRETTPERETTKVREEDFTLETLPGTNFTIAVPTVNGPIEGPQRPGPVQTPKPKSSTIPKNVQTGIIGQSFKGGGPDFIGGTVRETPITANSTLSFIINKLGVSASKASSIRTELRGGLDNFDTGTNTGKGPTGSTSDSIKQSRKERLEAEAERARQIFDAGSISNF